MKKWQILVAVGMVIFIGAWTIPLFDDPYYHAEKVTFIEWLKREIDELLHGEKE